MYVLGLVSLVNFPSMPVGFMQSTSYLHTREMQHKQSHKRNQPGEGVCYFRTLVVGCSVLSQVPEVCCLCCSCCSAKKPKFFIAVEVPLSSLPYVMLHSNGQIWNCFVGWEKQLWASVVLLFPYFRWSICFLFFTLWKSSIHLMFFLPLMQS